jgi:hypothetical protein
VWIYRRAAQGGGMGGMGGLMGIGRSKARRYGQESGAKVAFDDVGRRSYHLLAGFSPSVSAAAKAARLQREAVFSRPAKILFFNLPEN